MPDRSASETNAAVYRDRAATAVMNRWELQVDLHDAEREEEEHHRQRGVPEDLDVERGRRAQGLDGAHPHRGQQRPEHQGADTADDGERQRRQERVPQQVEVLGEERHVTPSRSVGSACLVGPGIPAPPAPVDQYRSTLRRLGSVGAADVTGSPVPRLGSGPVLEGLLEHVVDERAEVVVALLQADAVRLLGERVADELERAGLPSTRPARMMLSVVTASTRPSVRSSAHLEYLSKRSAAPAGTWPGCSSPTSSP